jgi:FlaA1/EpsC-like NDP-sugar epimerase
MEFRNILIIGAGIAGKLLMEDINANVPDAKVVGFVDDQESVDKEMKIIGKINELSKINKIYKIDEMIIAIPSADGELMRRILLNNLKNRTPIRLVPRSQHVIGQDYVKYADVKDFALEDFLGRPFLKQNIEKLKRFYKDKKVFITGGAGSIGSEIVKQLFDLGVNKVIVYDNSEYLIFNLDQELKENGIQKEKYQLVIGSILNKNKLRDIIKHEKPDLVFHAAAYKHVYLMEQNIDEAVMNNVIGTRNIVDAAVENKIKNFIFISTDKVVNPTSIMGSTKKIAEYYIKNLENCETKFNIVRFGNVINSNGSVLPLFERQIKERKYVTVTHKEVRRFFMSIREAAQLVVKSIANNNNGEIYILDMGELINIFDAAQCLIRTKNLIPQEDIKINFIGLKCGEKMIEELFTEKEMNNLMKTEIDNVFRLKNHETCPIDIEMAIDKLESMVKCGETNDKIKEFFIDIFPSLKNK